MKLSDLIGRVARSQRDLPNYKVEELSKLICTQMAKHLAAGGRVEIRGFGVFFLSKREPRALRHPGTGQNIYVAPRAVPRFKAGKQLRDKLSKPPAS